MMGKARTEIECENSCGRIVPEGDTVWKLDGKIMCYNCSLAWAAMNYTGEASGSWWPVWHTRRAGFHELQRKPRARQAVHSTTTEA